ncbi:hypothetical protein ABGT15_13170 [Flavobacterium enshiense]|uniref:hypothetical protein n=1 Tax=Flavobacterium enshiense TaxID=1341165 RepID=UPI00345DFBF4
MWRHKNTFAIGGLEDVGYEENKDILLLLSSQGEGIFDCISGEKIARKSNAFEWWKRYDQGQNSIKGFDILENIEIKTSGLIAGDNLLKSTKDGWKLSLSEPEQDEKPFENFTIQNIYLENPEMKIKTFITKDGPCEIRTFGFSETGKSFVIALSCEIIIYSRE